MKNLLLCLSILVSWSSFSQRKVITFEKTDGFMGLYNCMSYTYQGCEKNETGEILEKFTVTGTGKGIIRCKIPKGANTSPTRSETTVDHLKAVQRQMKRSMRKVKRSVKKGAISGELQHNMTVWHGRKRKIIMQVNWTYDRVQELSKVVFDLKEE